MDALELDALDGDGADLSRGTAPFRPGPAAREPAVRGDRRDRAGLRILLAADAGPQEACPSLGALARALPGALEALGHEVRVLPAPATSAALSRALSASTWRPDLLHGIGWRTAALLEQERTAGPSPTARVLTLEPFESVPWEGSAAGPGGGPELVPAALARGIAASNAVSVVGPPRHQRCGAAGAPLERLLEAARVRCWWICNGVDSERVCPLGDTALEAQRRAGRKSALQRRCGLPLEARTPLIGLAAQGDPGAGVDLVASILDELLRLELQLVVSGLGASPSRALFRRYALAFPRRLACWEPEGRGEERERELYAAADLVLAAAGSPVCPSAPRVALRCGAIPVATACPAGEGGARGPCLDEPALLLDEETPRALLGAVRRGIALYRDADAWLRRIRCAMTSDHSWQRAARAYEGLYRLALLGPTGRAPTVPLAALEISNVDLIPF